MTTNSDTEKKAIEIVNAAPFGEFIDKDDAVLFRRSELISAISSALAEERERCAKIAENDDSFMMLQDWDGGIDVSQKGQNIAAAIRKGDSNG